MSQALPKAFLVRKILHAVIAVAFLLVARWFPAPYVVVGGMVMAMVLLLMRGMHRLDHQPLTHEMLRQYATHETAPRALARSQSLVWRTGFADSFLPNGLLELVLDSLRHVETQSYGEYFFAVGVTASACLFLPHTPSAFTAAMLVLGFADSIGSLVGRKFGTHEYYVAHERRSYEGSSAVWVICLGILMFAGFRPEVAVLGATLLACIEAFSIRGSDNMTLPLAAGAFVFFLF